MLNAETQTRISDLQKDTAQRSRNQMGWGETPSSRGIFASRKSGLDGVSPHPEGSALLAKTSSDSKIEETKGSLPSLASVPVEEGWSEDPSPENHAARLRSTPRRKEISAPFCLVSGASGFIGRRLAARLATQCDKAELKCLVNIDDDPFCRTGSDFLLSHSVELTPVDLVSGRGLQSLKSSKVLFHLAANTHTWENDQRANDLGTENLLRAVSPLGPDNHVIFTSTVAVMDNRQRLAEPLTAETAIQGVPLSRYGRSKLQAEEHLKALAREKGFRLSIVRLCTVYGPKPRPNTFFDVLKREVSKRSIVSRLNWPGLTSFIHVDDVVECLLLAAENPPQPGQPRIQLLATESRTLPQVSALLYRLAGFQFRLVLLPEASWELLSHIHKFCRWSRSGLPAKLFNVLWRFDLVVNPVFQCDLTAIARMFPNLKPRSMEDCLHEV